MQSDLILPGLFIQKTRFRINEEPVNKRLHKNEKTSSQYIL